MTRWPEIVVWGAGIVAAATVAFYASPASKVAVNRESIFCTQEKAFAAQYAIYDILPELAKPRSALVLGDPVATYIDDCIFHVTGTVRVTDAVGVKRDRSFGGEVRLLPMPLVWQNVSVRIR